MRRISLLLPLALLALPAPEAAAQPRRDNGGGVSVFGDAPAQRQGPAALPGLQFRREAPPIPADPNQNLAPNAALFDAINRGDIAAAREAVGRGADIEARNVLNLTPIDAAVDQGRTEIIFYLLSVRGSTRGPAGPADGASVLRNAASLPAAARPATPPPRPAPRREAAAEAPAGLPAGAPAGASVRAPVVATPRLWAGDGGAARPEVGFLGFDAGRPAGASPPPAGAARPGRG